MKKIILLLILFFDLLSFSFTKNVIYAYDNRENDDEYINIQNAISEINVLEKTNLQLVDYQVMYDIENEPNYILINMSKGYAIISRENGIISEYDIYNEDSKGNIGGNKYYLGPFSYSSDLPTEKDSELKTFKEKNRYFLNLKKDDFSINNITASSWQGTINSSTMSKYSSGMWVNNTTNYPPSSGYSTNGICGTIAAAGLLAFYDDNVDNDYVPSGIRTQGSSSPGSLITTLFNYIDYPNPSGTIPSDVSSGINTFLSVYSYYNTGHRSIVGTFTFYTAKNEMNNGYPLCVGLLSVLGSTYGNHWVLAYQYQDNSGSVNDFYRCVDNHGSYTASVNVSWSFGLVTMEH